MTKSTPRDTADIVGPTTHNNDDQIVYITPGNGTGYPQVEAHTWGEFAGAVFELGGYGDMTLIDPYTGSRMAVMRVFESDEAATAWFDSISERLAQAPARSDFYRAMRRVIDVAEANSFRA